MRSVAVALLHYPVLDRSGQVITTAVTNLDVHDIARSAYTYGIERYFVVHPIEGQRRLVERVRDHWVIGAGRLRIPDRQAPMSQVEVVSNLADAISHWFQDEPVELWTTSASADDHSLSHAEAAARLAIDGSKVMLVFGTGWGLAPEVHDSRSVRLAPICSPRSDGYNHLSVRAAAAILFDRLLAPRSEFGASSLAAGQGEP